jgi:hypothetical protein
MANLDVETTREHGIGGGAAPPRAGAPPLQVLRGTSRAPDEARGARRRRTRLPLAVGAMRGAPPRVRYRWDEDTEILAVRVAGAAPGQREPDGAIELEGHDGSWVTLELRDGAICGLLVAVWPRVQVRSALVPPADAATGAVEVLVDGPALDDGGPRPRTTTLEVDTDLLFEADRGRRTYRLRVGATRPVRTVQVARDILCDVDEGGDLAGLWLLNVPPITLPGS